MNVRLKRTEALYLIFFISIFFSGLIAEGLMIGSLLMTIHYNRNVIRKQIGNNIIAIIMIALYFLLFVIHVFVNKGSIDVIRLYGLTKCTCTPGIIYLCYYNIKDSKIMVKSLLYAILFLNIAYIVDCFRNVSNITILGSVNGCSGVGVTMIPLLVIYIYNQKGIDKLIGLLAIMSTLLMVYLSDSTTTIIIVLLQLFLFVLNKIISENHLNKGKTFIYKIGSTFVIFISIISVCIANGLIPLEPNDLKTRVAIWNKAYQSHFSRDVFSILFGVGNNQVQMMTKTLEAHNMYLDIMLIYGLLGLAFIILYMVCITRAIFLYSKHNIGLLISVISYLLVCFLHPFYTGVFPFQVMCICSIMSLIKIKTQDKLEVQINKHILTKKRKIMRLI